jgi:hypothetical protein
LKVQYDVSRRGYNLSATQSRAFRLFRDSRPVSHSTAFASLEYADLQDNPYLQLAFRYRFIPIGMITKVHKPGAQSVALACDWCVTVGTRCHLPH